MSPGGVVPWLFLAVVLLTGGWLATCGPKGSPTIEAVVAFWHRVDLTRVFLVPLSWLVLMTPKVVGRHALSD